MQGIEQGSILRIEGIRQPVIVVSNDFFNSEGYAIVCPIIKEAVPGPLHIRLEGELPAGISGFVLCEQMRYMDLKARRFSVISEARYGSIMDISDAVMGIFE